MLTRHDAAQFADKVPPDFSWHEWLYALYALQQFEAAAETKDYPQGFFYNQIFPILKGLRNAASRKTVLGQFQNPTCIVCDVPVPLQGAVLDHIIPLSKGGPDNLENTLTLCRTHNSSKGNKDLIDWWVWKEWNCLALPRTTMVLYARLMWTYLEVLFQDPYDVPSSHAFFLQERAAALPSGEHRVALYGSTYAAMGFLGWERMHDTTGLL